MPRPKRSKIVSQRAQHQSSFARTKAPAQVKDATTTIPKQADGKENKLPRRQSSNKAASLLQIHEPQLGKSKSPLQNEELHTAQKSMDDEADIQPPSSMTLPEQPREIARQRRPLEDISVYNQTPKLNQANRRVKSNKTNMCLEDGFEEYLTSSSPRLPPVPISQPPSATRVAATPSFLSVANFKRRPRQPSILRMVQQDVANDEGHADDNDDDPTLDTLGSSSPIHVDSSPDEQPETRLPSSGSKRKAAALDEEVIVASEEDVENIQPFEGFDIERDQSPTSEPPLSDTSAVQERFKKTPPRRQRGRKIKRKQSSLPKLPSSSPPNSASSPHSTPPSNLEEQVKKSTQTKQNSRGSKRRKTNKSAPDNQTSTTASLQQLLPKSNIRLAGMKKQDNFDIASSSENESQGLEGSSPAAMDPADQDSNTPVHSDNDDDDGDYGTRPHHRRNQRRKGTRGPAKSQRTALASKSTKANVKTNATTSGAITKSRLKESGKTYGRQSEISAIDKENGEETSSLDTAEDDEIDEEAIRVDDSQENERAEVKETLSKSKELAAAKKTFQEVDDWELSFESCDVGGQSSSPWR